MNAQPQQITFDKTVPIICECGSQLFQEAIILRKVPKLLIGAPVDQIQPIPAFVCLKCQAIQDFGLRSKLEEEAVPPAPVIRKGLGVDRPKIVHSK